MQASIYWYGLMCYAFGYQTANVKIALSMQLHILKGHLKTRMEFKPSLGNVCSFNFNYFLLENGTNETEYLSWFRRAV